jgi:hypothetical protein
MPRIAWTTIDTYAWLDVDSEESKQYRTYLFYWRILARHLEEVYGIDPASALATTVQSMVGFRSLSATQFKGSEQELQQLLFNSWSNELMLYSIDSGDPRLIGAMQWMNVYSYYATGMSALAWLLIRNVNAPKAHRGLRDALANQVAGGKLFPEPWSCHLVRSDPLTWAGLGIQPADCNNLSNAELVPTHDGIGKLLKTTRAKRLDEQADDARRGNGGRLAKGARARLDDRLGPTTVFDYAWRSRVRANYGNPAMFFIGALGSVDDSRRYLASLKTFTDATMLVFEAFIGQRARATLVDAATQFISRDRSMHSDQLVGRRLRVLGLLR